MCASCNCQLWHTGGEADFSRGRHLSVTPGAYGSQAGTRRDRRDACTARRAAAATVCVNTASGICSEDRLVAIIIS